MAVPESRVDVASEYLKYHNGAFWAYGWLSNLPKDDYQFFAYSLNGKTDEYTRKFAELGTFRWLPFRQGNYLPVAPDYKGRQARYPAASGYRRDRIQQDNLPAETGAGAMRGLGTSGHHRLA